jgi:hypothetical protein
MEHGHIIGERHYEGFDLQSHLLAHQINASLRGDVPAGRIMPDGQADWMLCAIFSGSQQSN